MIANWIAPLLLALMQPTTAPAPNPPMPEQSDPATVAIARKIVQASGGDVFPSVKRIKFTFNVEQEGNVVVSRSHDWDLRAGTNTVTVGEQTVTVDLAKREPAEAYAWWTNDSYWLLMPLKLLDEGVILGPAATTRDMPPSRANFTMGFGNVGLTPGDQYDLSVDLRSNRITNWVYRPNADRKLGFAWDDYQDFNGLVLSTSHPTDDGKRRIFFTGIEVIRD